MNLDFFFELVQWIILNLLVYEVGRLRNLIRRATGE